MSFLEKVLFIKITFYTCLLCNILLIVVLNVTHELLLQKAGCYRAAIDLTTEIITGFGQAIASEQPVTHSPDTLQVDYFKVTIYTSEDKYKAFSYADIYSLKALPSSMKPQFSQFKTKFRNHQNS